MTRPLLDPGPPAEPRSERLQALEQALGSLDSGAAPGGRLLVLRAAERVAARELEFLRGVADEPERVWGACVVLLSTALDVLQLLAADEALLADLLAVLDRVAEASG